MPDIAALVALLRLATKDRSQLVLENIALRHQLAVYKRSVKRPRTEDRDCIFWFTCAGHNPSALLASSRVTPCSANQRSKFLPRGRVSCFIHRARVAWLTSMSSAYSATVNSRRAISART